MRDLISTTLGHYLNASGLLWQCSSKSFSLESFQKSRLTSYRIHFDLQSLAACGAELYEMELRNVLVLFLSRYYYKRSERGKIFPTM